MGPGVGFVGFVEEIEFIGDGQGTTPPDDGGSPSSALTVDRTDITVDSGTITSDQETI